MIYFTVCNQKQKKEQTVTSMLTICLQDCVRTCVCVLVVDTVPTMSRLSMVSFYFPPCKLSERRLISNECRSAAL